MDQGVSREQLDKVLALADSSHDAEALVAVRKARQMLSRDGLNFSDLARAAQRSPAPSRAFSLFSTPQIHQETQLIRLRQRLDDTQADLQSHQVQLEFWRRRAAELEQSYNTSRTESERWRQLAHDTVEKLWELGQEVRAVGGPDASAAAKAGGKTA